MNSQFRGNRAFDWFCAGAGALWAVIVTADWHNEAVLALQLTPTWRVVTVWLLFGFLLYTAITRDRMAEEIDHSSEENQHAVLTLDFVWPTSTIESEEV